MMRVTPRRAVGLQGGRPFGLAGLWDGCFLCDPKEVAPICDCGHYDCERSVALRLEWQKVVEDMPPAHYPKAHLISLIVRARRGGLSHLAGMVATLKAVLDGGPGSGYTPPAPAGAAAVPAT